ncbi:MAG: putative lipid II flippase FtsW [Oscillospiraceae bacterium]|nr:putative lipid II flippase FtsW [Oscillospiraceae bacterium]
METTARKKASPPSADDRARRQSSRKGKEKRNNPNAIAVLDFSSRVDVPMLVITLVLLVFGMTMMFSAGHVWSYRKNDSDSFAYISKQMLAAGIGLAAMFVLSVFDYRFLRKEFKLPGGRRFNLAQVILVITLILTAMTIPFGVSNIEGGPKRWLAIPLLGSFQPSDTLKVGLIIFMAWYIHKNFDRIRLFKYGIRRPMWLLVVIFVLMYFQPHLSGFVIMAVLWAAMLFVGGINIKPAILVGVAALAVGAVMFFVVSDYTYFMERVSNTFDPTADIDGTTYQSYQAVLAVGSGGFWGGGFGNAVQTHYYLPEAQNDFVFAVICEELGFIGGIAVMVLFAIFVFRGFSIARAAEDKFGMLLATGIALQVGLQAMLNIGVNVCCIPNTGISLPFFSYGGTALMVQLAEVGLMLSVSKRARLK